MELDQKTKNRLEKMILAIIGRYLDLAKYQVFFFGSRAIAAKGSERSDIDIGLEGAEAVSLSIMAKIKEDIINLPFLYKIDLVDFKRVSADFYQVAKTNIELIN
jgi:predicted nucleotidyltransferase